MSFINNPVVTIITVVFNSFDTIEDTIYSVINQTYKNVEFIVIDGNSTDGTKEIISKYLDRISFYLSEDDGGIYDAMNKGIIRAKGDWIFFLNSGDIFYDNFVLERILVKTELIDSDIFYGNVITKKLGDIRQSPKIIGESFFFNYTLCHQSAFCHINSFNINGLFNTSYKILSDREWFYRAFVNGLKFSYIESMISIWDECGYSMSNVDLYRAEEHYFRNKNFSLCQNFLYRVLQSIRTRLMIK